ncbi:S1 RNA-binding domain-containing protein [Streptomyces sp. NPDC097981]|uniref:S1 RNA-binding domain-containing protein n=1 Tax=Streptomyces sp. NPDC097981 TaxID=3155428 RepID=UPI00331A01D2
MRRRNPHSHPAPTHSHRPGQGTRPHTPEHTQTQSTGSSSNPLRPGEILSGTVAAIERFGVFVALDEGPAHPVFPGVGFISVPELSWRRFEAISDVVQVGERVSCEFLCFDTWNGEARLSLRATQPDPFQAFADSVAVGQTVRGRVT